MKALLILVMVPVATAPLRPLTSGKYDILFLLLKDTSHGIKEVTEP